MESSSTNEEDAYQCHGGVSLNRQLLSSSSNPLGKDQSSNSTPGEKNLVNLRSIRVPDFIGHPLRFSS
jgi:hypothetical protein